MPLLAQAVDPAAAVCQGAGATQPNAICSAVYDATGAAVLAQAAGSVLPAAGRILVILVGAFVANVLLRRLFRRLVERVAEGGVRTLGRLRSTPLAAAAPDDLQRTKQRTETIGGVLGSVTSVVVGTVATFLALGVIGIELGPLIAGAGIAGVALGFGAQSLVKDFLSGIFMLLEDQYGVGDIIDVGDASGVVEGITLRTTRLRDVEGTVWYVPNGEIRRVANKSQLWARSLIDVGVAYGTDVPQALEVIKHVADDLWRDPDWADDVLEEPEVWGVEAFGPSEILIRLVVKVEPARQWDVNRELRARLLSAFDREGIEIPSQRTFLVRNDSSGVVRGPQAATPRDLGAPAP